MATTCYHEVKGFLLPPPPPRQVEIKKGGKTDLEEEVY